MTEIDRLLEALADTARSNSKDDFDRVERELLSHFGGALDSMPREVYDRYLEIDRLWPVAPTGGLEAEPEADASAESRATLNLRLPTEDERFIRRLGTEVDRSASAVVAACLRIVRGDPTLGATVRAALRAGQSDDGDESDR